MKGTSPAAESLVALDELATYADRSCRAAREVMRLALNLPLGDPMRVILLDLFAHEVRQKPVYVSSACLSSGAPSTTALRYIAMLVEEGLVSRASEESDKRKTRLSLTDSGKRLVTDLLLLELNILGDRVTLEVTDTEPFLKTRQARVDVERLKTIAQSVKSLYRDLENVADHIGCGDIVRGGDAITHKSAVP